MTQIDYWLNVDRDNSNYYENFLTHTNKPKLLFYLLKKCKRINKNSRIAELGCNIGLTLNFLHQRGYRNLYAVDINSFVLEQQKKTFPELCSDLTVYNENAIDFFKRFDDNYFDLIYTSAFLQHIDDFDFSGLSRRMIDKTRGYIITIENEKLNSEIHFKRNYFYPFWRYGMRQIFSANLVAIPPYTKQYNARVFEKK